ncbi:MAG: YfhO family protein [Roseburia sp.]|nr:YfhO family protein [Roseburia sp.]
MQKLKKQKALCFLLFFSLAFAGITLCTYFLFLKNGKSLIWDYDGIKQHYAALVYLGRYYREVFSGFLHGDFAVPMFDFSLGMGEDIITTLNFYGLGDPLTLLAVFVPDAGMEYLYDFLVIFRIYLAGLAFSYFCRKKGRSYGCTLIGALIYAFSGYVLHVAVKHPFFVIPMILLPLSVIGLERALAGKRLTLLIVMVFFTALNGFYFFYMNTVFLVVYALVWVLAKRGWRIWRRTLLAVGRCVFSYVTGVLMAAVLFVPAIAAFVSGNRSESAFSPGNLLFFSANRYQAIFTRLIGPPRITWDYLGMVSLVFPALVVFFLCGRKMDKILKVNIIIWTVLMLIPFGGYALNGFSYVSGRFLYLLTFVYAAGTVYALPELLRPGRKKLFVCAGASLLYLAAVLFSSDVDKLYGWVGFIFLVITLLVCCANEILRSSAKYQWYSSSLALAVLAAVTALNIIGNGWFLFSGKGQGYLEEFVDSGKTYSTLSSTPEAEVTVCGEGEFYRTDASVKATENAAVVNGNYGVSGYFSISNPNRLRYLLEVEDGGVSDSMFKTNGFDDRTFLGALASVRYYATEADREDCVPYGYRFVKEFSRGGKSYKLYENDLFLPLGITFDSYMRTEDASQEGQVDTMPEDETMAEETVPAGLQKQEMMLRTVFLEKEIEGIKEYSEYSEYSGMPGEEASQGLTEIPYQIVESKGLEVREDGKVRIKKKNAVLKLAFDEDEAGELYVSLNGFRITRKKRTYCDITVSDSRTKKTMRALTNEWNWYFGRDEYLFNLGLSDEKRTECAIKFECQGEFDLSELKLYTQKMDRYEEAVRERTKETLQNLLIGKNSVSGDISLEKKKLLFLSIPYSTGWHAEVDGNETEILQADTAYMALEIEEGSHSVRLFYRTPYVGTGALLTAFGFVVFVLYVIRNRRGWLRKSGRKKKEIIDVLPHDQHVVLDEVCRMLREDLTNILSKAEQEAYENNLKEILSCLDDDLICQPASMHLEHKIYALSLKYGYDIRTKLKYRKEVFYFNDVRLYSMQAKSLFSLDVLEIKEGMLHLSGRLWCPFAEELRIWIEREDGKIFDIVSSPVGFRKAVVMGKEIMRLRAYEVVLPLEGAGRYTVYGSYQDKPPRKLYVKFGKFSHLSHKVEELYYHDGGYMVGYDGEKKCFIVQKKRFFAHAAKELRLLFRCIRDRKAAIAGYRLLSHMIRPFLKKERWLVMERINVAGDNAEHFYKFLKENEEKDIRSFFVISEDCADYERMKQIGTVLPFRKFRHKLNVLLAKNIISSQGEDNIYNPWDNDSSYICDLYKYNYIFLQHGIIKDDLSGWLNKFNKNLQMFVTSAKPEYRSILEGDYFYDESVVKLTGLPRYDNLKQDITPEKSIVFMPTWRFSLAGRMNNDTGEREYNPQFKQSEFYRFYQSLIHDKRLLKVMKEYGYTGRFFLHPQHKVQTGDFTDNDTIKLVRGDIDYQEEFQKNALLITDFSSVAFDFAYLKKPVIYTHFDRDTFFQGQIYSEGYFEYERDGLGKVCYDYETTLQAIIDAVRGDCQLEPLYNERGDRFYQWFDDQNCRRVYEEIRALHR